MYLYVVNSLPQVSDDISISVLAMKIWLLVREITLTIMPSFSPKLKLQQMNSVYSAEKE